MRVVATLCALCAALALPWPCLPVATEAANSRYATALSLRGDRLRHQHERRWRYGLHQEQTDAVVRLAQRLLKKDADRFTFSVVQDGLLPRHHALITNTGPNSVRIDANSGVAAAWALHHYLARHCSAMVTWSAAQVSLPAHRLPQLPGGRLNLTAQDLYTVMPNVCTFSYSYTWWRFPDWERHIDWMALHGVNLAYSLTGQERPMRDAYRRFGLDDRDLEGFFPGPAFLAWGRLGNLKKWGGPLSSRWLDNQVDLQRQILQMMTSLGMVPVLQGFSGIVPDAFIQKYPQVNYTRLSDWNNLGKNYSELVIIDPNDPMFANLSAAVVSENVRTFGQVTHHYAMDPFNENLPARSDLAYISALSSAIYNGFARADPDGVWVLQSWFLNSASDFWTPERAEAFFEPIPKNRLLVINLWSEETDLAQRLSGFFGHNFVWTALHNFGGNTAMYGDLARLAERGPFLMRRQFPGNMVGIGIQPEGINQNEIVYEFVMEFNWRQEPPSDLAGWARDYARRRYGRGDANLLDSWVLLQLTVYNGPHSGVLIPVLVLRPSLSLSENADCSPTAVELAWRLLIGTNQTDNLLLNYDQVDLTRQMLQIRFYQYYAELVRAAGVQNATAIESVGLTMLGILDSMDRLLETDGHFLLQKIINQARSFADGGADEAAQLYEFNVRNQLTCWGPGPYSIQDYAARMYNGLVSRYYGPRWALFVQQLSWAARQRVPFNESQFSLDVFAKVELPFYTGTDATGPAEPIGSPYAAVKLVAATLPPSPAASAGASL